MAQIIDVPGMGRVEFPDGMSDADIVAAIKKNQPQAPAPSASKSVAGLGVRRLPPELVGYSPLLETIKDIPLYTSSAVRSVGQGVMDPIRGAGQLVSNIADFVIPGSKERFAQYMRNQEQEYQQERAESGVSGLDVGRAAGNVLTGSLAGAGVVPAATLPLRMAQGAKIGGILGATAPVNPATEDYAIAKGVQIGGSAVSGGIAPPMVEGLIRGVGATVNALGRVGSGLGNRVTGQMSPARIESTLQVELQRSGVDWKTLSDESRKSIVESIQNALTKGGSIDPQAIARLADFKRIGIEPTRGQLSRVPSQFATEQNLARTEIGAPIAERLGQQNQQLIRGIQVPRAMESTDPYLSGQNVIRGLQTTDAPRRAAVTEAYSAARESAGIEAKVPLQPVAQKIGQIIEDFGEDKIPAAVMKRINEFGAMGGEQTRVFNIREAEKLKTLIGNNITNPRDPTGAALTQLRKSVDDAVNSLSEGGAGAEAAQAFQQARGLAARRFQNIERTPALRDVLSPEGTIAPEKFIEKFAIRGSIQETANLLRNLPVQTRMEVRGAALEWLKTKAVTGAGDAQKFTQAGFNRALDTIGNRKLDLIFGKQGTEQLRALGRVGGYIQNPPVASGVNYSASGTTILDALEKMSRLPLLSTVMGRPSDIVRANQVATALIPGAPVFPAGALFDPLATQRFASSAGLLAAPVAGVAPFGIFRPQ